MVFSSIVFTYVFLPMVLAIYYAIFFIGKIGNKRIKNNNKARSILNIVLLLFSIIFYAYGEPKFVVLMVMSIIFNYVAGLIICYLKNKKIKKIVFVVSILCNLLLLFVFKYLNFFFENIDNVFNLEVKIPNIVLPIGISFFTFQAISYIIDVYREDVQVQKNIFNLGLYISFFPQLIAGPIVRYNTIENQINSRKESIDLFSQGVNRFIIGFCKKVLLANNLAIVADKAFRMNHNELTFGFAWLGAIAYSLQIYYDFSGYSDMAIGLGKMFGFNFNENFNYPYISKSISEFWRRWHISLGTWFRDYVYFPLGGSRTKIYRVVFNLFFVWILTGLWHGANWTFIVWGLIYFICISFEKLFIKDNNTNSRLRSVFGRIITLLIVVGCWVIFRADSLSDAMQYLYRMVSD